MDKANREQEHKWESWYLDSGAIAHVESLSMLANFLFYYVS